eukprot:452421-Rhodomonas_salina.1
MSKKKSKRTENETKQKQRTRARTSSSTRTRPRISTRSPADLGVDAHAAAAVAVGAVRVRGAHAAGAARFDAHPEVARPREAVRIRCARGSARSFPTMSRDAAIRRRTRTAGGAQGPVRVVSVCTDPATAVLAPALRVRAARRLPTTCSCVSTFVAVSRVCVGAYWARTSVVSTRVGTTWKRIIDRTPASVLRMYMTYV